MSNGFTPKALLSHKLYTKSEFQGSRSPAQSINSGPPSLPPRSGLISPVHLTSSPIVLPFLPVKLQLPPTILPVTKSDSQVIKLNANTRGKKFRMSVKIRILKSLQSGI